MATRRASLLGHQMLVEFKGNFSVETRAELERAARFFANCLLPDYSIPDIELEIVLTEKWKNEKGNCEVLDFDEKVPTLFVIEIVDDKIEEQIETLAHEMVHLKQYHRGELRDGKDIHEFKWNRTRMNVKNIDYHDLPWEIEAYGREVGLVYKYNKKYSKNLVGQVLDILT